MGNYYFILRAQMRAFTPLARAMASDSAASPDSTAFAHLQHSLPTKRSVWGSARQYICITSHPKADGLFFVVMICLLTRLGCRFAVPSLSAPRGRFQTCKCRFAICLLFLQCLSNEFEALYKQQTPSNGWHLQVWAVDEAWTRDLFLTKEVLYHWATTAIGFYSGAKIGIKINFANFFCKKSL